MTGALWIALGAACGGFVNGLAGTGTALFALGFLLVALDPVPAVAIVALMSVVSGVQGLWIVRGAIGANLGRLAVFAVPGLVGVPFGIALLSVVDSDTLRVGIGLLLVVYGGYFSARRNLPRFERPTPLADGAIGGIGGVLGGAASLSGALPTIWLSMRPWPKAETRAVLQPYNVAILGTTVGMLAWRGAYTGEALAGLAIALPVGIVAAQVGIAVFRRLSDDGFRRLLVGLTLVLGAGILLDELL